MSKILFRVFVAAHKDCESLPDGYEIVQAGAAGKEHFALLSDDSGDNISEKNPEYCEMTVLYWIWKNIRAEYIGFVHYRRFFFENSWACSYSTIPSLGLLKRMTGEADILVAKPHRVKEDNIYQAYDHAHHISDLILVRSYIRQKTPEYIKAFDSLMNMKEMSYYNMFIAKEKIFHEYMEWVFPVLDYCYKHIDFDEYDSYNRRVIGFIAERLFNVWLIANKDDLRIKYAPVQRVYERSFDVFFQTCKGLIATCVGAR